LYGGSVNTMSAIQCELRFEQRGAERKEENPKR
jgi:hypothetical protein